MGRSKARRKAKNINKDQNPLAVKGGATNGGLSIPNTLGASTASSPKDLIDAAIEASNQFEPKQALKLYNRAIESLEQSPPSDENLRLRLSALQSAAFIFLEAGKVEEARSNLQKAVELSPDDGHEKYMYLAQLSQDKDAVAMYLRGIEVINKALPNAPDVDQSSDESTTKKDLHRALSNAFCALAELYMTDLCDEPDAEERCRNAVHSATSADDSNPQAWLSTANFRTVKADDQAAKEALEKCMSLYWPEVEQVIADLQTHEEKQLEADVDVEIEDENDAGPNRLDLEEISGIPFEAHIQMARMMMELDMNERAAQILEALLEEDDEYPEIFYLLSVVGQKLWTGSDPQRLRHYAKTAKQMASKMGDTELATEMEELLSTLPPDEDDDDGADEEDDDNDYDEISSSGDEAVEDGQEEHMDVN